jgi:leucyl aminopeptidase (aminopeptidase T)
MGEFEKYTNVIRKMLKVNMGLKDKQTALVLSDTVTQEQMADNISEALLKEGTSIDDVMERNRFARKIAREAEQITSRKVQFTEYPVLLQHGAEPSAEIAEIMQLGYNVIVAPTTFSLSHTKARKVASGKGSAIATLPMMKISMFEPEGPIDADYNWIKETAIALAQEITDTKEAQLTAPGTDIRFTFDSRMDADHGFAPLATEEYLKGIGFGMINMPSGEADGSPKTADGYFTSPVNCGGITKEPLYVEVKKGLVTRLEGGGNLGDKLKQDMDISKPISKRNMYARNVAELGVGLNYCAKLGHGVLEDEKVLGTCHVAVGNDETYDGGKCDKAGFHRDIIVAKASLRVGKRKVLDKGNFVYRPLPRSA